MFLASGTADEYRLSAGKPRLIYTKQTAARDARLTSFLDAIRAEGVVSYHSFDDAAELGSLVADDLAVLLTERFASAATAVAAAPAATAETAAPRVAAKVPAVAGSLPAMPSAPPPAPAGPPRLAAGGQAEFPGHLLQVVLDEAARLS